MSNRIVRVLAGVAIAASTMLGASSCSNIKVADGGELKSGQDTFFGTIDVGKNARVSGDLSTNNGDITVGEGSTIKDIKTNRGDIRVGDDVTVDGSVHSSAGNVRIGNRVKISRKVQAENGEITIDAGTTVGGNVKANKDLTKITGATITGNVENTNGDITLENATINGGVTMERSSSRLGSDTAKLTIGPNTHITGTVKVGKDVKIRMHKTAKVDGGFKGGEPEMYE